MAPENTNTIQVPYRRSLGPVFGAFMNGLTQRRITGVRCGNGCSSRPSSGTPRRAQALDHELVEVGPVGTVTSWTWVAEPTEQHPLDRPFAFALIRLDGASTPLLHAVDAGSPGGPGPTAAGGAAVAGQRLGRIDDIDVLRARRGRPRPEGDDAGPAAEPVDDDGLPRLHHLPESGSPDAAIRAVDASRQHRLVGFRCPDVRPHLHRRARVLPGRRLELGPEHEVDCRRTGTITNFTIVTPVQYPGQTETEPFAGGSSCSLDGTDVRSSSPTSRWSTLPGRRGPRSACGSSARCGRPAGGTGLGGMGGTVG